MHDAEGMGFPTADELAELSFTQQHPLTYDWAPHDQRRRLLSIEHQIDIDLSTDAQLAIARRDRFAPEQRHELFYNSWEHCAPGHWALLSMRYQGGDRTRPFVDVSASTIALANLDDVSGVINQAARRYGVLKPRYLRWWSSAPADSTAGTMVDKRFLAAPLGHLATAPGPAPDGLTVRSAINLDNYDLAVDAYASIDRDHPDHPEQAQIENMSDLADLVRDSTLFDVLVNDRWAGYVGLERGHKLGLSGYKVAELVLTERARGQRHGRWLHGLVARALIERGAAASDVLIGTIHADNTGAIKAARASGRHDIGGWNRQAMPHASRGPTVR